MILEEIGSLTGVIKLAATNDKYVYGSVAENNKNDVYDPYEENPVLKSKKKIRNNSKVKAKIVFNIFIIFGMFAIIMFRYATINQMNYDSNKLNKQYVTMQNDNELISIDILKAMGLKNIREVAENNLNMHKPDKSQIVYVTVPKEDVTILASKEQSKVVVVVKDVGNSIKKFLNLFY